MRRRCSWPHPTFAAGFLAALRRVDLPPQAMVVEVTESALMRELDAAVATLEHLSSFGVTVLIDDFGTGQSSLARLGELPIVDELGCAYGQGFHLGPPVAAVELESTLGAVPAGV
jgi:EAL domain-containing protein (putative c-di-GMP-specific phosphodiesterase class I)